MPQNRVHENYTIFLSLTLTYLVNMVRILSNTYKIKISDGNG